jgi:hypothetical protein
LKNVKNIIFLFSASLLFSCSTENNRKIGIINPEIADMLNLSLSDFAEDLQYIPLDNNIQIGNINRLEIVDSLLFVGAVQTELLIFDLNGHFKNKIGKIGKAPGEYRFGSWFSLDSKNKLVYLLDGKKVKVYSFDGTFIKEFSLEKYDADFQDIQYKNGFIYLAEFISFGHAKYDWLVLDESGNTIFSKLNSIPRFQSQEGGSGFVFSNDKFVYYLNQYNDTLVQINGTNFEPAYLFAKGEYRPQLSSAENSTPGFNILDITQTNKTLFIRYFLNETFYSGYFDSTKQKLILLNSAKNLNYRDEGPGIINNLDTGLSFVVKNHATINNTEYLVAYRFAYEIKTHVASDVFKNSTPKFPEKKKQLEKLANSLNENDNPVLMLVKLKE